MGKTCKNLMFQYMFILYLCLALLMAQASGLHMHVQHVDDHSSTTSGHIIDIHTVSTLHDIDTNAHHYDGVQDNHHPAVIDISQDYLANKTNLLVTLALITFFIGIFLFVPRLRCIDSQWRYKPPTVNPCYYLLQPLLRAPPVS
ncbi:MAG: hypothetical protein RQ982_08695 [Gammaproteobacteria bacterium]|nr:hypothetical protein [Gammaproteobacteria bacterium]